MKRDETIMTPEKISIPKVSSLLDDDMHEVIEESASSKHSSARNQQRKSPRDLSYDSPVKRRRKNAAGTPKSRS
jgi:hypothetical protein